MEVTNTLAYCNIATTTALRSFLVQASVRLKCQLQPKRVYKIGTRLAALRGLLRFSGKRCWCHWQGSREGKRIGKVRVNSIRANQVWVSVWSGVWRGQVRCSGVRSCKVWVDQALVVDVVGVGQWVVVATQVVGVDVSSSCGSKV
jgi:hypothetical protein